MDNGKDLPVDKHKDTSLETTNALEDALRESKSDDPLAAVKTMRLQQLAACRIKTAKALQDKMKTPKTD